MGYLEDYNLLKEIYSESKESIQIPGCDIFIRNFSFTSDDNKYYPDSNRFVNSVKRELQQLNESSPLTNSFLENSKEAMECDRKFIFPLYCKKQKCNKLIILFHGLNESSWDKYHTWAKRLVELTGQAVLMFPISYHINRRPLKWGDSRTMNALAKERKTKFNSQEYSFVNAAISTRLQFNPEHFFFSGLRTFNDVQKLISNIRNEEFKEIDKGCEISLFGYSIGAFLIEILIMARTDLFADSKIVLFCGGPTMDLMHPASKYIYDSAAERVMTAYYPKDFEDNLKSNETLKRYFSENESDGMLFRSLLNKNRFEELRTTKLKRFENQILAIPLTNDEVMPPDSVRETLDTDGLKIKIKEMHFPYEYNHISPFPLNEKSKNETNECFNNVFSSVAKWFN
ncbi:MAG: DUF6051 family protein [Ignavibacteria bacterium]